MIDSASKDKVKGMMMVEDPRHQPQKSISMNEHMHLHMCPHVYIYECIHMYMKREKINLKRSSSRKVKIYSKQLERSMEDQVVRNDID